MIISWPPLDQKLTKLREIALYIAEKSKDDYYFGATKLNKILFLIDFNYYAWKGESLTGAKYVHREKGPVPNEILTVIDALEREGRAKLQEVNCFGYTQKRLTPLKGKGIKGADTSMFDDEELSLVNSIIEKTKNLNASEISDWAHNIKPWQVTDEGEEIPYCSVYMLYDRPIERAGLNWAIQEVKRLKEECGYVP